METTALELKLWEREYREIQSIPSSTRVRPSKALLLFDAIIDFSRIRSALDAGCGNGRNAVHLASKGCDVIAADFSSAALESTGRLAGELGLRDRVELRDIDLHEPFPFSDCIFDLCLDSYVSCHFTDSTPFSAYWSELARVTRAGGYIFSSAFAQDDEYYQRLLGDRWAALSLVTDPTNCITKRLYSEDEFRSLFRKPLSILYFIKFQFSDIVLGRNFRRSLFVALLRKTT